jgi:prepilin signal peptidase PulO-like enzyme (type II secretory pathway)
MHLILCLISGFIIFGFFYSIFIISEGKWIGGGDVKIGFLLGLIVATPINSLLVIFIASLLGTFYSLPGMVVNKKKLSSHIPFGPFLILATIIIFILGSKLNLPLSSLNYN